MPSSKVSTFQPLPIDIEHSAKLVIDAAFKVHTQLGAGLLESVYQTCLTYELEKLGVDVQTQVPVPIHYDNLILDVGYRLDKLVNRHLIVEIKAADFLINLHLAQILTYFKLSKLRLGLLINFNVPHLRNGIRRLVI